MFQAIQSLKILLLKRKITEKLPIRILIREKQLIKNNYNLAQN